MSENFELDKLTIQDSWRLFKILSELVEGFETMSKSKNCISIFGSARSKPSDKIYQDTIEIATKLAENGYGIITGGGPGLMEAGNKGATEAGAQSIGLHIHLPHEQGCNQYVKTRLNFRYFFVRKLMFVKYATAYVVMPGGMGTIDEFAEAFVLAQTKRIKPFPIILYDSSYWGGFIDWVRTTMVKEGYINADEINLITMKDTPDEVVEHVCRHVALLP